MAVGVGWRLLLYLVRQIFLLSGKSRRILTTDVCGKHAKSERLVEGQKEWTHKGSETKLIFLFFFSYLSFLLVQTERAWFDIINTVESRHLEVSISNLSLYINQCGLFSLPGMVKHSSSTGERCPFPAVWERLWRIKDICDSELFSKDGGRWLTVHCS